MSYHAEVYWKDNCVKCKMTMQHLDLPYKPIKVTPEIVEEIKNQYDVRSLPLVKIFKDNQIVDVWSNFQNDKIRKWNAVKSK